MDRPAVTWLARRTHSFEVLTHTVRPISGVSRRLTLSFHNRCRRGVDPQIVATRPTAVHAHHARGVTGVRLRDASAHGLSRGALRGPGWHRTSYGLYLVADPSEPTLRERCGALLQVLPPGSAFSELTAASLHGWHLPPVPDSLPICVAVPPRSQPRRRGLRARRLKLRSADTDTIDGLRVTSPARTLTDLASSLALIDMVVLGDSALHTESCDLDTLGRAPVPRRGSARWRRATTLLDGRSESPWETLLRLVHVLSGLTQVEPQVVLRDEQGMFVGRGDLWLVGTHRLHEFDGGTHRERDQHDRDLARERRCARAGFERFGYTARDVLTRPAQIIRDAEAAFGLEPDPTRLRPWLAEIRQSLFTPSGQQEFRSRWRIDEGVNVV